MELALYVLLGDLRVPKRHANLAVAEQLHEGREAKAEPQHFSGERMPELVKGHLSRAPGPLASRGERLSEGHVQGKTTSVTTRKQQPFGFR